ncbi:TonB-dependent receptor [Thalassotalea euphylliae]|uniref:TonB-dependent receptor n=1 Tax=Thalassotalea euphylliae TaxID=1655234 RepID=A0A3E0TRR5_9GAMM|nr:TonB-dependent receptor [Thalassotalea euphylliae]REL27027.1 TonB-dependent receptor [Thalassotalea euphylliae]
MAYKKFNKSKLASSLSLILGASMVTPALAAESESTENVEVIEVRGIRSSLVKAMDIKRSSKGVVEAINAEDIGKFPDSNLAESLQRISGVAIDRDNGEGSRVSVRGFGPDRNLVLLNGRQMPTSTGDRSFDFANIASEMISGVEVYKTSDATIATGGIGATINVQTLRPLNNPGRTATISGKLLDDTSAEDGDITPELSGMYSETFADDTFGISIAGSYSERESGNQRAEVGTGWRTFPARINQAFPDPNAAWGGVPYENQINRPDPNSNDVYSVPQTTIYRFEEQQRERINGQLVLQYAPTDNFTATLDVTHMSNEIDVQFNDISAWYTFAPSENVWTDGPAAAPLFYSEDYEANGIGNQDLSMAVSNSGTKAESTSIGLNFKWQVNENLTLELDHHSSDAEETPNSPYGSSNSLSTAGFVRRAAATDFTGDLPILAVRGSRGVTKADMLVTGSFFRNEDNRAEIDQTQLKGTYELDEYGSIDFGVSLIKAEKHNRAVQVQRNDWGGVGAAGDLTNIAGDITGVQDKFDDVSGGNFEDHPDGPDGFEIVDSIINWDFEALRAFAATNYTPAELSGIIGDCGNLFCASTDYSADTDRFVEEEIVSYYVQWSYENEIGDMPYDLHIGLRYEETEIDSTSVVPDYTGAIARWEGDTEIVFEDQGVRSAFSKSGKYDHLLPNINFNLEITDDIKVRAAYSETIGRAGYEDLQGGTTVGTQFNRGGASGNSGNPDLEPLESTNYDLSFEWYYSESSYAAIGWFKKDVTNWIDKTSIRQELFSIRNPVNGPKYNAALAAVGGDAGQQRQWIFDNFGDRPEVFMEDGKIIIEGVAEDNLLEFLVTIPDNSDIENKFDGFEFALQHVFGDSGFGFFANYTLVDAGDDFNNQVIAATEVYDNEAIIGDTNDDVQTGISDTANFVLFYENHGISARLAYNWRDDYLEKVGDDTGANPTFVEAYDQLDFNISYDTPWVEGLSIFFEGINITDEYRRKHGRNSHQVLNVTQQGARYSLGVRYNF